MIDTDKYEGHTTDWEWKDKEWGVALCGGDSSAGVCGEICCDTPDGKLAQDAPLLLAEVKQLREWKRVWFAEVKRLREVAYRKDMQVGERDKEVKQLRKEYELISNLYMNLEKNYRAFLRGD